MTKRAFAPLVSGLAGLDAGQTALHYRRLTVAGTSRLVLAGSTRLALATSDRLILSTNGRVTLPGTARVVLDEFGTEVTEQLVGTAGAPGTVTVPYGSALLQYQRLRVSTSDRFTLGGRVVLDEFGTAPDPVIVGTPKTPSLSFTVPTDYFLDVLQRLNLRDPNRATLEGTADLYLTDDFSTRSRIVLAGRG